MRLVLGLLLGALALGSCKKNELRGWVEKSPDGKTYLMVEDDNAGCTLFLDGKRWKHGKGVAAPTTPGDHELSCDKRKDTGIGFTVTAGTTYHFDYWGP